MQGYMSEAQAALKEQLNNEELNAKVAKANAVKSQKKDGPLQFFVDMVPSNIFLSFNDSLIASHIFRHFLWDCDGYAALQIVWSQYQN